jgi:hypothetical protein
MLDGQLPCGELGGGGPEDVRLLVFFCREKSLQGLHEWSVSRKRQLSPAWEQSVSRLSSKYGP